MMIDGERLGHVGTIIEDLARVLRTHGFVTINEHSLRRLVHEHKEQFIEEHLGDMLRLRQLALQQDDLVAIRALLALPEVV